MSRFTRATESVDKAQMLPGRCQTTDPVVHRAQISLSDMVRIAESDESVELDGETLVFVSGPPDEPFELEERSA